jgi:hypothetical protein
MRACVIHYDQIGTLKKHKLQYKVQFEHKMTMVQAWSNNENFPRKLY